MTISQLLTTVNEYPTGTIAALVVGARKMGAQFVVDIKDGHTDIDRAQVFQSRKLFLVLSVSTFSRSIVVSIKISITKSNSLIES